MPRRLVIPRDRADEITRRLIRDHYRAIEDRQGWQSRLPEYYNRWRGIVPKKSWPWENSSNFHVPVTAEHLERLHAALMESHWGEDDLLRLIPVDSHDVQSAINATDFNNWAHRNEIGTYMPLDRAIHSALMWGTSVLFPMWDYWQEKTRVYHLVEKASQTSEPNVADAAAQIWSQEPMDWEPINDRVATYTRLVDGRKVRGTIRILTDEESLDPRFDYWEVEVEEPVVRRDHPVIYEPDIEDVIVPASATSLQEDDVWLRIWERPFTVLSRIESGRYRFYDAQTQEDFKDMLVGKEGFANAADADTRLKEYISVVTGSNVAFARQRDKIPVIKVFTKEDLNGDGMPENLVLTYLLTNRENWHLVGAEHLDAAWPHGERPLPEFHYIPNPYQWLSMGVPEWVNNVQKVLNTIHNQRVDRDTLISMPFFTYTAGSVTSSIDLSLAPGEGIPVERGDSVTFPRFAANTANTYVTERDLIAHVERLSGVNDFGFGMTPQRRAAPRTLGATMLLQNQGDVLARRIVRRQRETGLHRLFHQVHMLYARFGAAKRNFVLGHQQHREVSLEDLRKKFHFFFTPVSAAANKDIAQQKMELVYQMLLQNPLTLESRKRLWRTTNDFLLEANNKKNAAAYLGPEPDFDDQPTPQAKENQALAQGVPVPIHPMDDDKAHLEEMEEFEQINYDEMDAEAHRAWEEHKGAHQRAQQSKGQQAQGDNGIPNQPSGPAALMEGPGEISEALVEQGELGGARDSELAGG
jgi:hypothetical protein